MCKFLRKLLHKLKRMIIMDMISQRRLKCKYCSETMRTFCRNTPTWCNGPYKW